MLSMSSTLLAIGCTALGAILGLLVGMFIRNWRSACQQDEIARLEALVTQERRSLLSSGMRFNADHELNG